MKPFPEESQWGLLTAAGVREDFQAAWIEGGDTGEIAAELRVDPAATLECDLATALRWSGADACTPVLWTGGHSPGWTFALVVAGSVLDVSLPGRRVLDLCYLRETDEFYGGDGLRHEAGLGDLRLNGRGDESDLDPHLVAVGRVTGRFVDRGWLAERRTLCRVPVGVMAS